MLWVRIDNRLVHGQIIETWLPYTHAKRIIVVDDAVAGDDLQQQIMSLAIPHSVSCFFSSIDDLSTSVMSVGHDSTGGNTIILFSSCEDLRRALEKGFKFNTVNIGNIHYGPGKKQISPSVALSSDDESCLHFFKGQGIELDFRCVPNDPVQVRFS
ncbi:PTS sugar transporter subunit IIB [Maridesulfovibrio ferrireducens]|uniref:PTS sugar transporter subunit IIB n=1 Tax=Maridesulfovibrio ferrireducens TaxID=246191 RepID=UPI001A1DF734|nr:PTS sugar transporter subunit IIB [Maridesulfovibrio ferrireducens]MBI9111679.1 PTS sugar transporter subunit IIB [Maridesulfovibrio ferrireducens]